MANHNFADTNEPYTNPNLNETEEYTEVDLNHVLSQGDFTSWGEVIDWLHNYGGEDNFLHPGKVKNIHDDLVALHDSGEIFSANTKDLYFKIHEYHRV